MKKSISIFILFLSLVFLCSCSSSTTNNKAIAAMDYVNALKEAGFPIVNTIEYTEETDENELLGRPGQYIGKVNFGDSRIDQYSKNDPKGGTIEVFGNKNDTENRYQYIASVTQGNSMLSQYMYKSPDGLALLRLDHALTPSQAEQYQTAFEEFCKTGKVSTVSIS